LQDILEDSPLDLAPGHEISAAILDSGRLLSYLPESGPDADAPDDASYIEDTCLPVDDDLYDQVRYTIGMHGLVVSCNFVIVLDADIPVVVVVRCTPGCRR
jgi:hypothetical protein